MFFLINEFIYNNVQMLAQIIFYFNLIIAIIFKYYIKNLSILGLNLSL